MRAPFFWLALLALVLAVSVEVASVALLPVTSKVGFDGGTPGWGIRYLAILDALLLYTVFTMGLGLLLPRAVVGRIQGVIALVLSFFGLLGAVTLAFVAFGMLVLMVSLLVAVPFGTLAYMVAWGNFPATEAETTLALVMFLKLVFAVLLLLAQQRFLQNKGLVILTAVSLGATWVVAFLVDFPPTFLVSIADVIGALVIAVVGIIWLLVLFVSSLLNLVTVLKSAV